MKAFCFKSFVALVAAVIISSEVSEASGNFVFLGRIKGFSLTGFAGKIGLGERGWLLYGESGLTLFGRTSGRPITAPKISVPFSYLYSIQNSQMPQIQQKIHHTSSG